jgi:phytanoyl-CoA hydroxylase
MRHGYPVTEGKQNAMYHGVVGEKELMRHEKLFYLEMEAGDTVFFHPILLHGSGPNTTTGFRKAISTHYASSSETKYLESIEGTSREELGKEVEGVAKRKYGAEIR